jgi:hypothetical protein
MATFAYNSAMTDQKLPRKDSAMLGNATGLPGFDFRAQLDEIDFRKSGLGFAICGHEVDVREVPQNFPTYLAVTTASHHHAD